MKIWIFGLSWLWFLSVEKVFINISEEKKIKANLDQKFKFSYKEQKWRWNLWRLLLGLKSYPIGLIFFLQFSMSLKFFLEIFPFSTFMHLINISLYFIDSRLNQFYVYFNLWYYINQNDLLWPSTKKFFFSQNWCDRKLREMRSRWKNAHTKPTQYSSSQIE
jgi:hypothetical protein